MTDESTAIETTVSAEQWDKVVGFYTRLLGASQQTSDSEAIFASPDDGLTIRLVKEGTERAMNIIRPRFTPMGGRGDGFARVKQEHNRIKKQPGHIELMEPILVGPQNEECTISLILSDNPCRIGLMVHLECVIHNPNW
ncbi:hypothetical protein CDA63_01410 [Hymenobacter amundsenii]|uniref:Glyoxalase n=1 Tax=Hymenobacter amundsenii TaxID=2006685 RepID=A0A246FQP8_9BACT|nr:hypothetical protein [Hymenobacter amundsenii]OWP65040.1 hypothetical protein CDA63_01410 [Hymenobacter amundsenii]